MYFSQRKILPHSQYLNHNGWKYHYYYNHPNYYRCDFNYPNFSPLPYSYYSYQEMAKDNLDKKNRLAKYPEVDVTMFSESAIAFKTLLQEASVILNHLADSKEFAKKVMEAAQTSNIKEVDRLILSTGIKSNFKTTFNPDGLHLHLWSEVEGTECCKLDLAIRWS
ncbi:hypothetical protein [Calidifontibacillus oryziterrae]|uniref:hypothetical protein n=1 Tax=Calidifontibacillus oryziterrae TaxID=1191699 RepID=UPI00030C9350|nr:hypothetical protein [Calidifontibacillus oryziterrae]